MHFSSLSLPPHPYTCVYIYTCTNIRIKTYHACVCSETFTTLKAGQCFLHLLYIHMQCKKHRDVQRSRHVFTCWYNHIHLHEHIQLHHAACIHIGECRVLAKHMFIAWQSQPIGICTYCWMHVPHHSQK